MDQVRRGVPEAVGRIAFEVDDDDADDHADQRFVGRGGETLLAGGDFGEQIGKAVDQLRVPGAVGPSPESGVLDGERRDLMRGGGRRTRARRRSRRRSSPAIPPGGRRPGRTSVSNSWKAMWKLA